VTTLRSGRIASLRIFGKNPKGGLEGVPATFSASEYGLQRGRGHPVSLYRSPS
jgi:hypothetical protein